MKAILAIGMSAIAYAAHMSETCETVLVKGKSGPYRINKSDYDANPGDYALFTKDEAEPTTEGTNAGPLPDDVQQKPAPSAPDFNGAGADVPSATPLPIDPASGAAMPTVPSPDQFLVVKDGRKFFVVTATNDAANPYSRVEGVTGIDEAGYKSDTDAWAAVEAARAIGRLTPGGPFNG